MDEKKIMEGAANTLEKVLMRGHATLSVEYIKLLKKGINILRNPPENRD